MVVASLPFSSLSWAEEQEGRLPRVVLQKEDGGRPTGEPWDSRSLFGKPNLLLYLDPGKRREAMPLIQRIDSLGHSPETLGVTFVVNTSATSMPGFMIRLMIRQREKVNPRIHYVLDEKEVLIREWGLTDEYVNAVVLGPSGEILHRYAGEITDAYIDRLMGIVDLALRKKALPRGP
jgi:predicted transcriptional regulator